MATASIAPTKRARAQRKGILIELGATALVVFALTISLVGFHIKDVSGGIALDLRIVDVISAVLIAIVGRGWLILMRFGQYRIVTATAGLVAAILIVSLIFGGAGVQAYLPFKAALLHWLLAVLAVGIAIGAAIQLPLIQRIILFVTSPFVRFAKSGLRFRAFVLLAISIALVRIVIEGHDGKGLDPAILNLVFFFDFQIDAGVARFAYLARFILLVAMALAAALMLIGALVRVWLGSHEDDTHTQLTHSRMGVMDAVSASVQRSSVWIGVGLFLFAAIYPFIPGVNLQYLDIGVLVLTYIMLGWGLNIVVGLAGLLDLGYVAFYAVGAYSFALLASPDSPLLQELGWATGISFWIALPLAGLMAALTGVTLGFPVLRLRGDYLAIVTLGFGEMIRVTLLNFYSLTKGPDGISKIPPPSILGYSTQPKMDDTTLLNSTEFHTAFGIPFDQTHTTILLYFIILVMALATNFFTVRVRKLPVGRAWEALREDEIACRALGINPTNTKLTAFGLGAMFGGFAGSFFATRQTFVSPESFTFIESAVILAIVVLGGFGSQIGVVVAAFLLIGLPEIFRELQEYRMLFFGGSMVLIMLWRPSGLLAHREPTIRLKGGKRGTDGKPLTPADSPHGVSANT